MKKSLKQDQNGAILLMGLFMGVLLVSCLYFLIGIGDALVFREKMQDAADASIYSAAIIHARGMNIIVLINILMAAILAILVVLKMISTLCIIGIAILTGLAFFTAGASLGPVPLLEQGRQLADTAYEELKEPVFQLLRAGNKLSGGVAKVMPIAAAIEVERMAMTIYSPPTQFAVMFPLYQELPVENDEFDVLCGKAGEFAGQLAGLPLKVLLGSEWLSGLLGSAVGGLAKTFASYFCGGGGAGGGGKPPEITYDEPTDHPSPDTPEGRACEAERNKPVQEQNQSVMQNECKVAGDQHKLAADSINFDTGDCQAPSVDACEARKNRARAVCRQGATDDLEVWWWQERKMRRRYKLVQAANSPPRVERVGDDVVISSLIPGGKEGADIPPCIFPNGYWSQYNSDVSQPVCIADLKVPDPEHDLIDKGITEITVDYREVSDVLACQSVTEKTVPLTDTLGENGSEEEAPKRVKDCANLGDPAFQIKVAIKGDIDRLKRFEPGVKLAAWGQEPGEGGAFAQFARGIGALAFAQAEFYWGGGGGSRTKDEYAEFKAQWMWSMQWQARLRRVQLDEESKCEQGAINIDFLPFADVKRQLNKLVLH